MSELTEENVRTLSAGNGDIFYRDGGVPGLYVRVRVGGSRTYIVQWRQEKKQRRVTIGKVGVWSLDQAREEARKMLFGFCSKAGRTESISEKPFFKHHLYRHWDKSGVLLYVGISLSAFNRLRQHKRNAYWFNDITRVTIEGFETKTTAEAAERFAIKTENPLYNIHYREIRAETKETRIIPWQEYFRSDLPRKRRSYLPVPGQLSLPEM